MADRVSVPVNLSRDEIQILRDLVMKSDLDVNTKHALIAPLAQGLLRFGSPVWENRIPEAPFAVGREKDGWS